MSPVGDEPPNPSCVSIHFYPLGCRKPIGMKDEWKNLTLTLASDAARLCELTLQLWQWFSPFFPGDSMISPVGISWIFSSIIVPFSPSLQRIPSCPGAVSSTFPLGLFANP